MSLVSRTETFASAEGEGAKYLRNVFDQFSRLSDYKVDVRVHLDLESVKAPDMSARIFYKSPDKIKIDSRGAFLLPKQIGVFNPHSFNPDNYDVNVVEDLQYNDHPAVKLALSRKGELMSRGSIILTVDKTDWLVKEISVEPGPGSLMTAVIQYGDFGQFKLPTEVDVTLNFQRADSSQIGAPPGRRYRTGVTGSVAIYYSNYGVNTGLSDSLFEKKEEK